jgi:hypothetical protein
MTAPTENDLKALIRSPKPAFAATGITADANRGSTFEVVHDGRGSWMIERPARTELLADGRTVLVEPDEVKVIDIPVAVNNDVKSALDGRRLAYLSEGSLEIIGSATVAERHCLTVRASGLKQGEERPFEFAIDAETGCILRITQEGKRLFEVKDFRVGVIHST